MNPLVKAISTALLLAASATATALGHGGLPFHPSSDEGAGSGDAGNSTGNQTAGGNSTGNATGNSTSGSPGGNGTSDGGSGNATGNQTSGGGNQTAGDDGNKTSGSDGNETAGDGSGDSDAPQCTVAVDDWDGDLMPGQHEWEWLVSAHVHRLQVEFYADSGIPLGGQSDIRLTDGAGRTVAHGTSGELSIDLQEPSDYIVAGGWRLSYDSSGSLSDYSVHVALDC